MKKILKRQYLIVLCSLFFLSGCEDELQQAKKTDHEQPLKSASSKVSMSCSSPTLNNGMLDFKDEAQFYCYYDYLAEVAAAPDDERSEDDLLLEAEQNLGLNSLRAEAFAKFEQQNAIGWSSYQEIPEEHWITSPILRSILNVNREVKVGNYVVKYLNPEFIVSVKADRAEMLKKVELLGSNPSIEQIIALDPVREIISVSSAKNIYREFGTIDFANAKGIRGTPVPVQLFRLSGTIYEEFTCSSPGKVKFEGFTLSRALVPQQAKYRIEFNDGTNAAAEFTLAPNQYILPTVEHVYPGANTVYHPTVKVKSISPYSNASTWNVVHTYNVYVKGWGQSCSMATKGGLQDMVINSSNVLRGKIDYYNWSPFPFGLGGNRSSLAGWTELHHIDKNGNWNRRKDKSTTLCVKFLQGTLYQGQYDLSFNSSYCMDPIYLPDVYECRSNTNQKRVERHMGMYNTNTRATAALSSFTVQHEVGTSDGVSGSFKQTIYGCP
ncbi:hypothetical protein ACM46_03005 [Chryseobacterium angstadtii]|uniref:Uncharacterized protein n=1 Tax=Chryseobacterium angstadtii TaxID=558151 RepID=A0A0J7IKE2_9FLAO|nr:hypothetical protein [Chryseobacterium angstadtii]KMQ66516.1 hypothetical protein ACM46_03005 [Chryseobacterium angstadtii]